MKSWRIDLLMHIDDKSDKFLETCSIDASATMESILLSLVSSYLKDYVNNFRKEQISVSILLLTCGISLISMSR